jgi:alkylhydroperoxidase/carboxymuconolactone decarboxylase family protein YurZ
LQAKITSKRAGYPTGLDEKAAHLIQLGAAATLPSERAVYSPVRRALEACAGPREIHHAIMVLTSTIGFPNVAAALRWAEDVIAEKGNPA